MDWLSVSRAGLLISFVALSLSTLRYLVAVRQIEKQLEARHPQTWESLGKPNLFWNNSPRMKLAFMRFLKSGQCESLDDAALAALAGKARSMFRVGLRAALACAVFFALSVWIDPA